MPMIGHQPSLLFLGNGNGETPSKDVLLRSSELLPCLQSEAASSSPIAETDPHGDDWEDDDEELPPGQEDGQPNPPAPSK